MIVGQEKPSLEDLAHVGVLGMKWGHRKAASTNQIRKARRNVDIQKQRIADQKDTVNQLAKGTKNRAAGEKKLSDMKLSLLKNPDRATAARLTRGEKYLVLTFGVLVPPAFPVAVAKIAATSAISRRIEQKQDKGKFDKKKAS